MALTAAGGLCLALALGNYYVVAGVLVVYVAWMFRRDSLGRRNREANWTRIK